MSKAADKFSKRRRVVAEAGVSITNSSDAVAERLVREPDGQSFVMVFLLLGKEI